MKYDVEIVGVSHVARCENLVEVYEALRDSQCVKMMTIEQALLMAESLRQDGVCYGMVAEDRRWRWAVREVKE